MKLILMRHGDASAGSQDELRPLSPHGKSEVEGAAEELALLDFEIREIVHSPLLRAKESAKIVAAKINFEGEMVLSSFLQPYSDIAFWKQELDLKERNVMLIGHLPYMGILAGELLSMPTIGFNTADVLILERNEDSYTIVQSIST